MKKKVGYDIDNVVTKTWDFALDIVNEHLGTSYTLDDCLYATVEECFDIPKEEANNWFKDSKKGFPEDLEPIPKAKEVINKYNNLLTQYFVSARSENLFYSTLGWFDKNGFIYNPALVILGGNRPEIKASIASQLSLDLFVEDSLDNANALAECGIPVLLVDFNYKFNQNQLYYHDLVKTVKSWDGIEEELKKLL